MTAFPINRLLSSRVTPRLAAFGVTPHQVTLLSLAAGLGAGWIFFQGDPRRWVWGALWLEISYLLDNCDGELARMTRSVSGLGSWLDTLSDGIVHAAFFLGLGAGLARLYQTPLWLHLGRIAAVGVCFTYVTFVMEQVHRRGRAALLHPDPPVEEQPRRGLSRLRKVFREDFALIVLGSALAGQMGWLLVGGISGSFLIGLKSLLAVAAPDWKAARRWAGVLAGAMLFFWVLRAADLPAVWQQVKILHWRFVLVFLFYAVIFGLDTLGWRFALRMPHRSGVRWDRLFRTRLAGEAVNYVTPTAWIGGEPVKAYLLSKRYGFPMAEGMTSVVIAKTTFSVSMFLFILAGIGVTLSTQRVEGPLFRWVWMTLPVLGFLLGAFLLVQFLKPFQRGGALLKRWAPAWLKAIGSKVRDWDETLVHFYRNSPREVLLSLGFHFMGWVAGAAEVFFILRFLGIPVAWSTAWSLEALWVLLKSGAFLIPASLGAGEGFMMLVCAGLGLNVVSGLALALVRRAREILWMGLGLAEFSRQ